MAITSSTSGPTTASVVDIGEGFEDSIANIESLSEDTNAKVANAGTSNFTFYLGLHEYDC